MPRQGHTPYRTCIVCRSKRPKEDLVRLVLDEQCLVIHDRKQRLPGRGAYACASCLKHVVKGKALFRAFRGRLRGVSPSLMRQMSTLLKDLTGCETTEDRSLCVRNTQTRPRFKSGDTAVEDF